MLYDELKQNYNTLKKFISVGVLPPLWLTYLDIYEDFNAYPGMSKEQRYEMLSEKYGYKSSSSIKKIIQRLNR